MPDTHAASIAAIIADIKSIVLVLTDPREWARQAAARGEIDDPFLDWPIEERRKT